MPLPINMTALLSLREQLGHKRVAQGVMALLLIYIANLSAEITWSSVPSAQSNSVVSSNNSSSTSSTNNSNKLIDISKIRLLNLFGQYDEKDEIEEVEVVASDAPETSLNLTLSGLVASDDKQTAAAIIENKGTQETYGIGDIITGTRASLEQVLMDRVLIKQSGRLETLMLDGFDYNQPAESVSKKASEKKADKSPAPVDKGRNKALSEQAKNLRKEISADPGKISDYLRISPKRKNNKIVGYSLRPGKKPEFFKLSGLKSGDVAVQMNGFDLTETMQAMQAMAEMKEARNLSLLVERQGELTEISINLD